MRTNSDEKNVDLISKVALCVHMSVCHRNYKLLQNCQYWIGVYWLPLRNMSPAMQNLYITVHGNEKPLRSY